jgi:hypothetical protein
MRATRSFSAAEQRSFSAAEQRSFSAAEQRQIAFPPPAGWRAIFLL